MSNGKTGPKATRRPAAEKSKPAAVVRAAVPASAASPPFEPAALEVLNPLQAALLALIDAVPGRIERSTDLQRLLSLDPKLAWQVYKFATAPSVLPASSMLPGLVAMKRFCKIAGKKGVDKSVVANAEAAFSHFERFVADRAGDRQAFNSMVGGGRNEGQSTNLVHKKSTFRASAHFLGTQTETIVITFLLHPSTRVPGNWDAATLIYKVGIRRLRPDARIQLAHVGKSTNDDKNADPASTTFEPIESNIDPSSIATLLRPFCSNADAETVVHHDDRHVRMELAAGAIGTVGATDWAFGVVERNSRLRPEPGQRLPFVAHVSVAVETLLIDILVHDSVTAEPSSKVATYVGFIESSEDGEWDASRLNINESIVPLGRADAAAQRSDLPRYGELIHYACDRLGWDASQFKAYRCRVEYPILGTSLDVHLDYPTE